MTDRLPMDSRVKTLATICHVCNTKSKAGIPVGHARNSNHQFSPRCINKMETTNTNTTTGTKTITELAAISR